MARTGTGVEPREHSIRIGSMFDGVWTRETLKLAPTPANVKYAERTVKMINERIKAGTFEYAEFFPKSKRAPKTAAGQTFGEACDNWLATKGQLATKTKTQYRNALEVWKELLAPALQGHDLGLISEAGLPGDLDAGDWRWR